MKYSAIILLSLFTFSFSAYADNKPLSVSLVDPAWDGKMVPVGRQWGFPQASRYAGG
jgi:hypothetical protein